MAFFLLSSKRRFEKRAGKFLVEVDPWSIGTY
jgi:hypothetical protein